MIQKKAYEATKKYRSKFPEKKLANSRTKNMKPKIKGNHLHHWSYKDEHHKDVIELTPKLHALIHRLMDYDTGKKIYSNGVSGEMLDTKEKHLLFIRVSKFRHLNDF